MRYFRRTYSIGTFTMSSPSWRGETRQLGGRMTHADIFVYPHMDSLKTPEGRWNRHIIGEDGGPSVPMGVSSVRFAGGTVEDPHVFSHLFVDENLRAAVPTLAALTLGTPERLGMPGVITHDTSLTPFSSRLSRRALDKGVIAPNEKNPEASPGTVRYSGRFASPVDDYRRVIEQSSRASEAVQRGGAIQHPSTRISSWEEIPHEEVQEARSRVRRFLRGS